MSNFRGSYLRVLTPVTTDGNAPVMGDDDKKVFKETHLPLTAKKIMERKNEKLPSHLRAKIEVVGEELSTPQAKKPKK